MFHCQTFTANEAFKRVPPTYHEWQTLKLCTTSLEHLKSHELFSHNYTAYGQFIHDSVF